MTVGVIERVSEELWGGQCKYDKILPCNGTWNKLSTVTSHRKLTLPYVTFDTCDSPNQYFQPLVFFIQSM